MQSEAECWSKHYSSHPTWESYQGFYLCALPWKQSHLFWFFIISFRSLFSSLKALLKAPNCFTVALLCCWPDLQTLLSWNHSLLSHQSLLFLSCLWCVARLKESVLFMQVFCHLRHNFHVIRGEGLALIHMHWGKMAQIAGDMKQEADCTF